MKNLVKRIGELEKRLKPEEEVFRIVYRNRETGKEIDGGTITFPKPKYKPWRGVR